MLLPLERQRTRQPFSGRVNLGCPLVEGLAFLVNGADPTLRDLVSGIIPTLSSASAAINTSSTCLGLNRSTSGGWHNYGRTRADEIAVGSVLFIAHDVERVPFFGSGENSLGNGFEIALDNSAYGTNSFYLSGNNAFIADAGFNALESWQRPQVAFFTWDGVNTIAYSRGRVAKTTSTAYTATLNTNRITRLATRRALSTDDSLTKRTLIAAWNRPLRPAEIQALTENPWQLFEPRRIWVPQSAAAGLPALSASTYKPGTLTSTGWTPRITAT